MRIHPKNTRGAFTLVEVMLVVGVMAIAISSMIGLLSAITANINQIRQQNKAVTLVANVETILKEKNFDTVYQWVLNPTEPHVIYFWDEYQNPDDPDNSSLVTISSEQEGMMSGMPPDNEHLKRSEGEVYRVLVSVYQEGLKGEKITVGDSSEYGGGALPGDSQMYAVAYLPVKVEILADPRDDIISGMGEESQNVQRRVYDDVVIKMR